MRWPWRADGFAALGAVFATPTRPQPLQSPHWVAFNHALVHELEWERWLYAPPQGAPQAAGLAQPATTSQLRADLLEVLAGNAVPPGCSPVATVYSGHQFGVWAGRLGDGRALLLGTLEAAVGPMELQLKGSGRTRYSRMGDGRAVLRSSIREYLCSEAMHGLGIPTTRALALVGSATPVYRERAETAAVLTRVAPSFLRFGHFEHFSANQQLDALRQLADYAAATLGAQLATQTGITLAQFDGPAAAYLCLLAQVTEATAQLLAQWQAVGFVHGVMNTDNMSVLGLTLDYGPFQFLDGFEPYRITNHSDAQGRYVLARQPAIGYWNLRALAQALAPLIEDDARTVAVIDRYQAAFPLYFARQMAAKLGGRDDVPQETVHAVLDPLLQQMAVERTDYTIFWRRLSHAVAADDFSAVRDVMRDRAAFDAWLPQYRDWLHAHADAASRQRMLRVNPCVVLRNHLAEQAIARAEQGDFSEVARLLQALHNPYEDGPAAQAYADFPPSWAQDIQVSCSS
ncbi:hypothetical protein AAV94_04795 [Lampropedia cohaerens]|uniref:Protein nucleotidyltransferase YdiU n=1 Tax=Lampropedia cohaerens TaxID=1610491 RepID=A0A0U1Q193_9BURK|nr:YdiU family protein [Lampropedia cohaerens]KKW68522.1 hypothetical protein AAV94_04795 [Lampropedia cohaerens]